MIKTGVSCCIIITCARGGYPPLQGGYFGFGRANIVKYRKGGLLQLRLKTQLMLLSGYQIYPNLGLDDTFYLNI